MRRSALVVFVPEAEPVVEELRARHDSSARVGVPAHVTILVPFIPADELDARDVEDVRGLFAGHEPFAFSLARIETFPGYVYVAPEPAASFVRLTQAVAAHWPEHPPYEGAHDAVVPHLTVGELALGADRAEIERVVGPTLPIASRADEVVLMEESEPGGRWRTRERFALGPG